MEVIYTAKEIHIPIEKPSDKLKVFLFNVGQGDHLMLQFPDGSYGLIDFFFDPDSKAFEPPSLSYFKALKKTLPKEAFDQLTISFFCISHTDKDHVKGVANTISWFYENGILIKDIWLGAARDKTQMVKFLREKVNALIDEFDLDDRLEFNDTINSYNRNLEDFFEYFEKWKKKDFNSLRYENADVGLGEYLCDIRSLRNPCSISEDCEAVNIGPLGTMLDDYLDDVNLEIVKTDILKIEDKDRIDKNLISHILKIKFGEVNLLFGGDTHIKIWEKCLEQYDNTSYPYIKNYGNYDANFIKVSHHGSRNSSNEKLWQKIISNEGNVFLGISAGRHGRFKHPHSETLKHIKTEKKDATILSTNICSTCLNDLSYSTEHHYWYDEYMGIQKSREKKDSNKNDKGTKDIMKRNGFRKSDKPSGNLGLFGYAFEISKFRKDDIKVKILLTAVSEPKPCFYFEHQEKLYEQCEEC